MILKYPINIADVKIILKRRLNCYEQPTYEITLTGEGLVTFQAQFEKQVQGNGTIDPIVVFNLFKYAFEIGFFDMRDIYNQRCDMVIVNNEITTLDSVADEDYLPSCSIEISIGEKSKTVQNIIELGPKHLLTLEKRVEKFSNTKRFWENEYLYFNESKEFGEALDRIPWSDL